MENEMKLTKRQLRTLVRGSVPQYQGKVKSFNLWKRPPASQSITLDVCSISVNYFLAHIGEPERTDILSPDFYEFMTSKKGRFANILEIIICTKIVVSRNIKYTR